MMMLFEGVPLTIADKSFPPRWLVPFNDRVSRLRTVARYGSFWEACQARKPRTLAFHRGYALGDILMLIPIARAIHRVLGLSHPITLIVGSRFLPPLVAMRGRDPRLRFMKSLGIRDYSCDLHMDLNACLEVDHRGGPASDQHRMELYAQALGLTLSPEFACPPT